MSSIETDNAAAAAVQKSPSRVSLDDIEAAIVYETSFTGDELADDAPQPAEAVASLSVLSVHLIVMRNGFTVIGKSAPADAANFDRALGARFAREDAIRQIWPLMGFALGRLMAVGDDCATAPYFGETA